MVQSADTIENFNMDRFDRYWKKFVEYRQSVELQATLDRSHLKHKNDR